MTTLREIVHRLKVGCPLDTHAPDECAMTEVDAILAIKELFKGAVPMRIDLFGGDITDVAENNGRNSCREETLRNMEKL